MFTSQQPKTIESTNWYHKIAMTIFYYHVLRYINKLKSLLLQYLRKLKILEKNHWNSKGYTNKIEHILVTKSCRELKLVSNDCYNNVL